MKIVLISVVLSNVIYHCNGHFTLLTFPRDGTYAKHLILKMNLNLSPAALEPEDRYNLCVDLLKARLFYILDEFEQPLIDPRLRSKTVSVSRLASLKSFVSSNTSLPYTNERYGIRDQHFSVTVLRCISGFGKHDWHVLFDPILATGLLFQKFTAFSLIAIVDYGIEIPPQNKHELRLAYLQYYQSLTSVKREQLCTLKKHSVFRLCSICADALARSSQEYDQPCNITENEDMIIKHNYNFWDQGDKSKNCPVFPLTIDNDNRNLSMTIPLQQGLLCKTTIAGKDLKFIIKANLINFNLVFLILEHEDGSFHLKHLLNIPQMRSIWEVSKYRII